MNTTHYTTVDLQNYALSYYFNHPYKDKLYELHGEVSGLEYDIISDFLKYIETGKYVTHDSN